MRQRVSASVAIFSLAVIGAASAADLPLPTKEPPPYPVYNWTGFYFGANGGGGWSHDSFTQTGFSALGDTTFSGTRTGSGGLAGGQIGFNYEFPNRWVLGIEADADWANISGASSGCPIFSTGPFTGLVSGCGTAGVTLNDFGTVRGRVGYAFNNVLVYGSGGWAWGNSSGRTALTCLGFACPGASTAFTGGTASFSNSPSGWTAGAGIEWGFLPNWSIRVEYLHVEFDNISTNYGTTITTGLGPAATTAHVSTNSGIDIARVGINYLFNFGSPRLATGY
jgi:outer membrane immunogenic protein